MNEPGGGRPAIEDLDSYFAIPRLTDLAVSDTGRVVVAVNTVDDDGGSWVGALWELDPTPDGGLGADNPSPPRRLTRSAKGESSPVFLPDGTLLFVSARNDDDPAVWALPPGGGEAEMVAGYPGGVRQPVAAAGAPVIAVLASRPVGADPATDPDGAKTRAARKDRKLTSILHTGMPIRYWDHELGDVHPRLLLVGPGRDPVDVAPDAGLELSEATHHLSADGTAAVTTWKERLPHGRTRTCLALIDTATQERRRLVPPAGCDYSGPRLAPDGSAVAAIRSDDGDFSRTRTVTLCVLPTSPDGGTATEIVLDDVHPTEWCWSPDGSRLYVAGDWQGRGVVVAVDPASGQVTRRLASDAAYTNLVAAAGAVYALRSTPAAAPGVVRLDPDATDQVPTPVELPAANPILPGEMEELTAQADDGRVVRAWLCRPLPRPRAPGGPAGSDGPGQGLPAPVMLWIHGGPFTSWNGWSWRWNPWLAVSRGWAVLLPDPALSTGYGREWLSRAWPHRAARVWRDLEAVLDAALARPDLDGSATACLGASFGGYMTNWISGHTDRFAAIVTHAGLWALDQQHATTDAAEWKTGLFGTPAEHPEWYEANSPHHFADRITTPMLVVHGNRDYRVPVSEALRLWWDLVSRHAGPPEEMPHRFLQFTGEHHWVLSPANSRVWNETVLGFCDHHVRGLDPVTTVSEASEPA